jgi:hypothetical protein
MASQITLENIQIVLSGTFDFVGTEDATWSLIARGAKVMTSVTKATGTLVVGAGPKPALLDKARSLGIPILGPDGLRALMDGTPLREAIRAATGAPPVAKALDDLRGKHVVVSGVVPGMTHAAVRSALDARGAKVTRKPSRSTDLVVAGEGFTMDALIAIDEGVPFLQPDAFLKVLGGTPLSDFVGEPTDARPTDPAAHLLAVVEAKRDELLDVGDLAGEVWDETLSVTLLSNGRVKVGLVHLGGTPIHDHVRKILQKERWPRVEEPCRVDVKMRFR